MLTCRLLILHSICNGIRTWWQLATRKGLNCVKQHYQIFPSLISLPNLTNFTTKLQLSGLYLFFFLLFFFSDFWDFLYRIYSILISSLNVDRIRFNYKQEYALYSDRKDIQRIPRKEGKKLNRCAYLIRTHYHPQTPVVPIWILLL